MRLSTAKLQAMEGILAPDSAAKSDKGLLGLLGAYGSEDEEEDTRAASLGKQAALLQALCRL